MSTPPPLLDDVAHLSKGRPLPNIILWLTVLYVVQLLVQWLSQFDNGESWVFGYWVWKLDLPTLLLLFWLLLGGIGLRGIRMSQDPRLEGYRRFFLMVLGPMFLWELWWLVDEEKIQRPMIWALGLLVRDLTDGVLLLWILRHWVLKHEPTRPVLIWEQWVGVIIGFRVLQSLYFFWYLTSDDPYFWSAWESPLPFVLMVGSGAINFVLLLRYLKQRPQALGHRSNAGAIYVAFHAVHLPWWEVYKMPSTLVWITGLGWIMVALLLWQHRQQLLTIKQSHDH